jgi:hypothetical protein
MKRSRLFVPVRLEIGVDVFRNEPGLVCHLEIALLLLLLHGGGRIVIDDAAVIR